MVHFKFYFAKSRVLFTAYNKLHEILYLYNPLLIHILYDLLLVLAVLLPVIVTHPSSQLEVLPGGDVQFTVVAEGDSLQYQWQKDNDNIDDMTGVYSGTNTATLTVHSASEPEDEGVYIVAVFNIVGLATTDPATLEVGEGK